jgi:hypothetical protein
LIIHIATSPEARYQALVTLIGGVVAIGAVVGGVTWRAGLWVKRQADAVRANTAALVGTPSQPGLIETVAEMRQSVDRLTTQLEGDERGRERERRRRRGRRL